jgi:hypothetical protein
MPLTWQVESAAGTLWLQYQPYYGLWSVTLGLGSEGGPAPSLRAALAEAAKSTENDPWIVAMAGQIRTDLQRRGLES